MKVLNNIIKHIGNNYEANREYVLESYTKVEEQPTWHPYLGRTKKAPRA